MYSCACLQGPFLRLEIPHFIKEHNLFGLPNICKQYALYTDVDIIFANRITQHDIQTLSKLTGKAVALYGREYTKGERIENTGVMVVNVELFKQEVPHILDHKDHWGEEKYPQFTQRKGLDQGLINSYRAMNDTTMEKFKLLPMHYNWKAYWGLEPSNISQVKIIHFHGLKPGLLLEDVARCNITGLDDSPYKEHYEVMFRQGVCCDQGRTAEWSIHAFHRLVAPKDELC